MGLFNIKKLILLTGDIAALYAALFLSLWARNLSLPDAFIWGKHWPAFTLIFCIWIVIFFINGFYDLQKARNSVVFFSSFLGTITLNFFLAIAYFYITDFRDITPKTILLLLTIIYIPLFGAWRVAIQKILSGHTLQNRVLCIGLVAENIQLIEVLTKNPQIGFSVAGVIADYPDSAPLPLPHDVAVWSSREPFEGLVKTHHVDTIVVAAGSLTEPVTKELYKMIFMHAQIVDLVTFYEMITHRVPVLALNEAWFLENIQEKEKQIYDSIKIFFDYLIGAIMAAIGVVILIPVAALIYFYDKGPIFIKQKRVGRDEKEFMLYKFRTMVVDAEKNGAQFTVPHDKRITPVGRVLRVMRIDELPQALNILRGEMSFIGPRPERPEFVEEIAGYMPFYHVRHLIKPGLTGWAQINRGYYATREEHLIKLQYDLYYIKHRSLLLDGAILLQTVRVVVKWLGR
ncbi:sugar transferase [Candidatus Peregrinibacteria bacterium]|nr:sugar transferase [Candidatus Peregrinibacteria bacterium]